MSTFAITIDGAIKLNFAAGRLLFIPNNGGPSVDIGSMAKKGNGAAKAPKLPKANTQAQPVGAQVAEEKKEGDQASSKKKKNKDKAKDEKKQNAPPKERPYSAAISALGADFSVGAGGVVQLKKDGKALTLQTIVVKDKGYKLQLKSGQGFSIRNQANAQRVIDAFATTTKEGTDNYEAISKIVDALRGVVKTLPVAAPAKEKAAAAPAGKGEAPKALTPADAALKAGAAAAAPVPEEKRPDSPVDVKPADALDEAAIRSAAEKAGVKTPNVTVASEGVTISGVDGAGKPVGLTVKGGHASITAGEAKPNPVASILEWISA